MAKYLTGSFMHACSNIWWNGIKQPVNYLYCFISKAEKIWKMKKCILLLKWEKILAILVQLLFTFYHQVAHYLMAHPLEFWVRYSSN